MCSLDITLTQSNSPREYNGRHDRDHSTHFKRYLELLIPHIAGWRKFAIQNGFVESISTAFSALTDLYAPALETLVAMFATDWGQGPDMEVFSRGPPRLSSMELGVSFRPPQGAPVNTLKGYSGAVLSAAFSPNSNCIVSASSDGTLRQWDAVNGEHLRTFTGHSGPVRFIAFSPDGVRIVSGSSDNSLQLWDATSGAHLSTRGTFINCGFCGILPRCHAYCVQISGQYSGMLSAVNIWACSLGITIVLFP
jgi:WD40 repeat protein